jgi:hypothetical protein
VPIRVVRPSLSLVLIGAIALVAAGCDAEPDLRAYFGSPLPSLPADQSPAPTRPAEATAQPTLPALPSPSPTPTPSPTPSATPSPTATPSRSPRPTGTPSPTRPPNLADFPVLRERAAAVTYDQLLAQPGRYEGELVFLEGRVLQVRAQGTTVRVRVRVAGGTVVLEYDSRTYWGQPLVPQDRVRLVGYGRGVTQADGGRMPVIEVYDLVVRFT